MRNNNVRFSLALLLLFILSGCSNLLEIDANAEPSTVFSYTLQESGHVKIWIENPYKTTVSTLVNEHQNPGNYVIRIRTVDYNGDSLTPGAYTIHIKSGTISHSSIFILSY